MAIPAGRGFGSSAVAYAAGVAAALEVLRDRGKSLPIERELKLLSDLEGHPDNICTARLGGWNFFHADDAGNIRAIRKSVPKELAIVILYPNFSISTAESRQVLPESYSMRDILCNLRGVSLWFEFLHSGDFNLLAEALKSDRLHEPHRIQKIPGFAQIKSALLAAGATGVALSGSGPGMIALFPAAQKDRVLAALKGNSLSHEWVFETSEFDEKGLIVERG